MIKYIKKNWIISAIISIALLLFIGGWFKSCQSKQASNLIVNQELSSAYRNGYNTATSAYRKQLKDSIDSVNTLRAKDRLESTKTITTYKNKNSVLTNKISKFENDYNTDTTKHTLANCDSLVGLKNISLQQKDTIIKSTEKKLASTELSLTDVTKKYFLQVEETEQSKNENLVLQKEKKDLIGALKRSTGWWSKNDIWFYLGAGAIGGYFIAK